jgi:hypothetical protein
MKPSIIVTAIFLLLVSLAHLLRLILQVKITANTFELPMWASVPAFIVTLVLAIWLWLENKK